MSLVAVGATAVVVMLGAALLGQPSAHVGGSPAPTAPPASNEPAPSTLVSGGPLVPQARIPRVQ